MPLTLIERFHIWRALRKYEKAPPSPTPDRLSWEATHTTTMQTRDGRQYLTSKPLVKSRPSRDLTRIQAIMFGEASAGKTYYAAPDPGPGNPRDPGNPHGLPTCPECFCNVATNSTHRQHHLGCSEPAPRYPAKTPEDTDVIEIKNGAGEVILTIPEASWQPGGCVPLSPDPHLIERILR